jgi:methylglutaconyl-CoA hydratase
MSVKVDIAGGVARVTLERPQVHNAFDEAMIAALTAALAGLDADPAVRVVVLQGAGPSFCAGADLDWMRRTAGYSQDENLADARRLAALLATLANLARPTLARVHGNAFGGGVGLCACCDIALCSDDARFALSEVRLGLIPATIGPYVVDAIGARQARRYFLTGERFDAATAWRMGLVHDIARDEDEMDQRLGEIVEAMLQGSPAAQREAKELIRAVASRPVTSELIQDTAERIARVRASPEGREGVAAFLEKRRPSWIPPEPEPPAA